MNFPQLRVRTGFSTFVHETYGRMPEIFDRLEAIGAKTAGIVDVNNTWGHVKFEKEARKRGIQPAFGVECPLIADEDQKYKPRAWLLAADTRQLYRTTSWIMQNGKALPMEKLAGLEGIIRFSGGCLDFATEWPEAFDYIDVNPASLRQASAAIRAAEATGLPLVLTSNADLPDPEHKPYAYAWRVRESVGNRYLCDVDALWASLEPVMQRATFDKAVENAFLLEEKLQGIHLQKAPLIHLDGSLEEECRAGIKNRVGRGHIKEWTQAYEDRLQEELYQIQLKEFDSYFLVVADMIRFAKTKMLVGPARGSSSGSIVCYLLGITEVDPLVHRLMFQRFVDVSRGGFEYEKFKGFEGIPYEQA